jgi:glyoxylase-like metal-dependent hydrolase (beta-lactamase superfamily II)
MIYVEQVGEVTKFRMARTFMGRGLYYTAAYFVDGLLIDSGCAHTVSEFMNTLGNRHVRFIVNTHSHEDHIAANKAVQTKFGAQILAHSEALPILADSSTRKLRPYQIVMWGYPQSSTATAIGEELETEHHKFRVIHTPGHSPDHITLYEPNKGWIFSGDTYVGGKDKALRADYNIWQIIESLRNLASLDSTLLFPGSGTTRDNPREELLKKVHYLEETGQKIKDLHSRGWSRARIRRKLFGPEMSIAYYTLGHFSGKNLVRSYIEDSSK